MIGARRRAPACLAVLAIALGGCAQDNRTADYMAAVQNDPIPTDEAGRQQACEEVRANIADQENRASMAQTLPPLMAMSVQNQVQERVAALQDREGRLNCSAPTSAPAVESPWSDGGGTATPLPASSIDQCITACKTNTGRSPTQCFDACNH